MTFTFLSDTAGINDQFKMEGETLVHCGNFYQKGEQDPDLEKLNAWFAAQTFTRKLIIPGSDDAPLLESLKRRDGLLKEAEVLDGKLVELGGLTLYGVSFINMSHDEEHGFKRLQEAQAAGDAIPTGIDILATHVPPFGILDESASDKEVGCLVLRDSIRRAQPRYHFFGHDIGSPGYERNEETKHYNVSQRGPFKVLPRPWVMDLRPTE